MDRQRHQRRHVSSVRRRKLADGFTLIELMIVISIVGILAAIGIEKYTAFLNEAKRSEAMAAIDTLWGAEEALFAETGHYTASFNDLSFRLDNGQIVAGAPNQYQGKLYRYVLTIAGDGQQWMVRATGDIDGDIQEDIIVGGNFTDFTAAP